MHSKRVVSYYRVYFYWFWLSYVLPRSHFLTVNKTILNIFLFIRLLIEKILIKGIMINLLVILKGQSTYATKLSGVFMTRLAR